MINLNLKKKKTTTSQPDPENQTLFFGYQEKWGTCGFFFKISFFNVLCFI